MCPAAFFVTTQPVVGRQQQWRECVRRVGTVRERPALACPRRQPEYDGHPAPLAERSQVRARIGEPISNEKVEGAVRYRDYQNGRLTWTEAIGVKHMEGHIFAKYLQEDGLHHWAFGAPTTDETSTPDGVGRFNHFAGGGSIYWTVATGPHLIYGGIKKRWQELGWERSYLGYPTSGELDVPGGRCSDFQHGSIFYNSATGVSTDRSVRCKA
ncbi:LGFP repeat-containing protein [Amycolatopsis sp. cmx-11-12]|uniref:LGFP repeat-containing protein n=1 Tax=Amycolatopsis sp. cmx-11-12 TaxID=2785795 RepID=UPI003917DC4D